MVVTGRITTATQVDPLNLPNVHSHPIEGSLGPHKFAFQIKQLNCCSRTFAMLMLATSEAELQELVDRLDHVSRKYSLLINVDKTKVMAVMA